MREGGRKGGKVKEGRKNQPGNKNGCGNLRILLCTQIEINHNNRITHENH